MKNTKETRLETTLVDTPRTKERQLEEKLIKNNTKSQLVKKLLIAEAKNKQLDTDKEKLRKQKASSLLKADKEYYQLLDKKNQLVKKYKELKIDYQTLSSKHGRLSSDNKKQKERVAQILNDINEIEDRVEKHEQYNNELLTTIDELTLANQGQSDHIKRLSEEIEYNKEDFRQVTAQRDGFIDENQRLQSTLTAIIATAQIHG